MLHIRTNGLLTLEQPVTFATMRDCLSSCRILRVCILLLSDRWTKPKCNRVWTCVADNGTTRWSDAGNKLHDVPLVPELPYNLLSVSKVTEAGKTIEFSSNVCSIMNHWRKRIATDSRISSLYCLNCQPNFCQVNTVREKQREL